MAVEKKKPVKTTRAVKGTGEARRPAPARKSLRIELLRSLIGHPRYQREVVKGLGLRKVRSVVVRKDSPEIWGMIRKVMHLVKVEAVEEK